MEGLVTSEHYTTQNNLKFKIFIFFYQESKKHLDQLNTLGGLGNLCRDIASESDDTDVTQSVIRDNRNSGMYVSLKQKRMHLYTVVHFIEELNITNPEENIYRPVFL